MARVEDVGVSEGGRPFKPVLLGADTGVYAIARAFHEAYSVRSVVVSLAALGPVAHSGIVENVVIGADAKPEDFVSALVEVASRYPDAHLILMANTDWLIRFLVTHRARLETHYTVPVVDEDVLARVADKASFAEICEAAGVPTPRTVVQDFGGADDPGWTPADVPFDFPVIAKAANSADYERLHFPGKRKVYQADSHEELREVYSAVVAGGFRGRFVVQEMIPGDDTQVRSITCYVDTQGRITLSCCAHVLLEEHTPSGLGNPAAMITGRWDEILDPAHALLRATGFRGYANFDVKVDPRTGAPAFLEVNPRIGRNNFYVTAAGVNPMRFLVRDVVDGEEVDPVVVERQILYSIVPLGMLGRYVLDPGLRATVKRLIRERRTANPLKNPAERRWRRRFYVTGATLNHIRKFRKHYPKVTATGL